MRSIRSVAFLALVLVAASACGERAQHDTEARVASAPGGAALPTPLGAAGGVTGMPEARDPQDVIVDGEEPADAPDPSAEPMDPAQVDPGIDGELPLPPDAMVPAAVAASSQDAVAVIRDYYAALNSGAYGRAYGFWADGGRASGQSAQQFAEVFSQTDGHSVEISPATRIEASPSARQADVPVMLVTRQRDGAQRRFAGHYVLRQTAGDAGWRIVSADLREVAY